MRNGHTSNRGWKSGTFGTLLMLVAGTVALAGCGTPRAGSSGEGDRITREQLEPLNAISSYDAILRLRPTWLQARGSFSIEAGTPLPRVHINDSRAGTLDDLRSLPVTGVETIRFLNASDATIRFGTGYPGGVIEVRTRR